MIKHIARSTLAALPLVLAAQFASGSASEYSIEGVSLDGSSWTDATTSITVGQTYALGIDLRFELGVLFLDPPFFTVGQNIDLNLLTSDGALLGSASSILPNGGDILSPEEGTFATWFLEGSLSFQESFGGPGVYNVAFSSAGLGEGGFNQELTVQAAANPVPAPGTLAILALGLLGLTFLRRRASRG